MPRKDLYHDAVRNALIKDGWIITHDPLVLPLRRTDVYIDLGAESQIGAEKEGCRIAVEIKTFRGLSSVHDLENALGQYHLYHYVLSRREPERRCFLAVSHDAYQENFADADTQGLIAAQNLHLIVFDVAREELVQWIPEWMKEKS